MTSNTDSLSADPLGDLPFVRRDVPIGPMTWYRIGGPAKWFVQPRSTQDLRRATRRCHEAGVPVFVLGRGANLLVCDAGVDGAVFRLDADAFTDVTYPDPAHATLQVGAGADLGRLVLETARRGWTGLENLAGIPATIGGAARMNAGGRFGDFGQAVSSLTVMQHDGTTFTRTSDDLLWTYRHVNVVAPFILAAELTLEPDDPVQVTRRMKEIWMYKNTTQPLNTKSAGCMFKNPTAPPASAGALIDAAGLKGRRVGGAEVSEKHANFLIAHPGCTAADVETLVSIIRESVAERHGVMLESEVQRWP